MKGLQILQEQLEKHKECLKDVDESIKKLTGRNQNEPANGETINKEERKLKENNENRIILLKRQPLSNGDNNRNNNINRRDLNNDVNRNRLLKRRHDDLRSNIRNKSSDRESEVDEPKPKHAIQSSVISKQAVIKSREDLIKLQNKDANSEKRNKRLFGMILGTLQKFKTEDKVQSETSKAKQRKEIEKKIEVKEAEEKNKIKNEKKKLFKERNRQQYQIHIIEEKLKMIEELQNWEKQQNNLKHFIRTKSKPYIYFLPKVMEDKSEKLLSESAAAVDEMISKKRAEAEKEIEKLANNEKEFNEKLDESSEINKNDEKNAKFNKNIGDSDDSSSDSEMDDDRNDVKLGEDDDDDDDEVSDELNESKKDDKIDDSLNNNENGHKNDNKNLNEAENIEKNDESINDSSIVINNVQHDESINENEIKSDGESE